VTKQPNGVGVLSSALHIVAPKKIQAERNATPAAVQLKPLVPIPLPCSPGQRRSCKTTAGLPLTVAAALGRHRSPPSRVVVLPDNGRCPGDTAGKPVSPLISPTRRSLSPKEVVRGAYVRMQDPTECLETSLDEIKSVVKRSDSYRQANATSPRLLAKSPNMLMALQKARSETTQGNHFTDRTDIW
jgi:hypothetical protein